MTDLTAKQLHKLMQPLLKREPELLRLHHTFVYKRPSWYLYGVVIGTLHATQLCESSMVRWLAIRGWRVCIYGGANSWIVDVMKESHADELSFSSSILVEALAAACTACLDTNEK